MPEMPATPEALQRLLVALLVGLLIGLDRERAEERKARRQFAGVRTFPLITLLGAGLALLRPQLGVVPLAAGLLAVGAITLVSYQAGVKAGETGATTEVAALLAYVLGALAGNGQMVVAGAAGVTVAVLLAVKPRIEGVSRAMSEQEVWAVLELAVISAIVLPLLPDRGYGPWQVWNPFKIWMVVVLVSAASFAGFVAVRWKGEQGGLYWASALGSLVSSTATTVALAQRSRAQPEQGPRIAAAALLASVVMGGRLLVLVTAARPPLLPRLLAPVGAMIAVGLAIAYLVQRRAGAEGKGKGDRGDASGGSLANPFSLRAAILFGLLFAGVQLLVRASEAWLGARGTLLAALLAGLVDVDAVSIAVSRGARPDGFAQAALDIVAACASNDLFKAGVAVTAGGGLFRSRVALGLVAMAAAGVTVAALQAALW
jgi:uncharacterized membrane protein (DUF4010 family)